MDSKVSLPSWTIDTSWLDNLVYDDEPFKVEYESKKCKHKWKPTLLIFSTVFDCEVCGIKKEDEDKV